MFVFLTLAGLSLFGLALMPFENQGTHEDSDEAASDDDNQSDVPEQRIVDAASWISLSDGEADCCGIEGENKAPDYEGDSEDEAILGTDRDDYLEGLEGEDLIQGGAGNDVLDGVAGEVLPEADYIRGGSGDDLVIAGPADLVSGGVGHDTFVIVGNGAFGEPVTVQDFNLDIDRVVLDISDIPGDILVETEETETGTQISVNSDIMVELIGVFGDVSHGIDIAEFELPT